MGYAGQNARFGQIAENAGMEGHRARTAAGKRKPYLPPRERPQPFHDCPTARAAIIAS